MGGWMKACALPAQSVHEFTYPALDDPQLGLGSGVAPNDHEAAVVRHDVVAEVALRVVLEKAPKKLAGGASREDCQGSQLC